MGRYIDDILQPGEKVLYSTNVHWIFYLPAIGAWIVAVAFRDRDADAAVSVAGGHFGARGIVLDAGAWFYRWTTETDVTNLRVVLRPASSNAGLSR